MVEVDRSILVEEVDSTLAEEDSRIPGVEGNNLVAGDNSMVDLVASSVVEASSAAALAVKASVEMAYEASGLEEAFDPVEAFDPEEEFDLGEAFDPEACVGLE